MMSEDRVKIFSRKETGTVPKIKYGNNRNNHYPSNQHNLMSNNLSSDWLRQDFSGLNPNPNCSQNIHPLNYYSMETSPANEHNYALPRLNSELHQINMANNGPVLTPNSSEPQSRRDSVATIPKCQNIPKFPDKQKLEDKLSQIREYLRVTTSLMSTLKNSEDPQAVDKEKEQFESMIKDLTDSETKLLALLNIYETVKDEEQNNLEQENCFVDSAVSDHMQKFSHILDVLSCPEDKFIACNTNKRVIENGTDNFSEPSTSGYQSNISQRNEIEDKVEQSNRKIFMLQEQQNALIKLQKKAENQLLDAKLTQENWLKQQQKQNEENRLRNDRIIQERIAFDQAQTRAQIMKPNITENNFDATIKELEDTLNGLKVYHKNPDIDTLQERLESSNQLIHMLGTRDAQLNSEHLELQEKLQELQSKKDQIDNLASELQNLNEDNEDEDIGQQVKKIVTMKQQLTQLKDMLDIVKNAELRLVEAQNDGINETDTESLENFNYVQKNDNIRQNVHSNNPSRVCDNVIRIENNARFGDQWPIEKESNKISSNIRERERMLAELKAKKRELEEIIFKQKDRTLINNDICSESSVNKSEISSFEAPTPSYSLPPSVNRQNRRSPFYASDECPENVNEYSEIRSEQNFRRSNSQSSKHREEELGVGINPTVDYSSHFPSSPSRSLESRSNGATSTNVPLNRPRQRLNSNKDILTKNQIQKQLETIQSMCQSLMEQQNNSSRSNHTPSPLYAEPRRFMTPGTRESSILNVVNPVAEAPVPFSTTTPHCFGLNGDISNNQNLLAANTLQLQAFLLNTLNQCCQMLWFQQREIASLRHTITSMQERMLTNGNPGVDFPATFFNTPPSSNTIFRSPPIQNQNQPLNSKINQQQQVPVSAACSMPNLNQTYAHAQPPLQNNEMTYDNRNNVRMLDAAVAAANFNNVQPLNNQSEQPLTNNSNLVNNVSTLHGINAGVNQWNGPALNNQVAPGNRANNYWDNFRSYSRQNLLSTSKSNEGVQNASGTSDRTNRMHQERSHSQCTNYTLPKSNAFQNESTISTSENQSIRAIPSIKPQPNSLSSTPGKSLSFVPPDVLNVSHLPEECVCATSTSNSNYVRKFNLRLQNTSESVGEDRKSNYCLVPEENQSSERKPNVRHSQESRKYNHEQERRVSNTSEESGKDLLFYRNRNEWVEGEESNTSSPKSKLFEQLRDSVYKEVANLISANEARPHFLIQLFRDLQLVNSDPLRHRTLHSIQSMITNPIVYQDNTKTLSNQLTSSNQDATQDVLVGWAQSPTSSSQTSSNMEPEIASDLDVTSISNIMKIVAPFLKRHQDDIFQEEMLEMLKALLIKSMPFGEIFSNTNIQESTFHKHFAAIITEALYKFQGKRVQDVRKDLIRTITEVLLGEFSFIHLVQENIPEGRDLMVQPQSGNHASGVDENVLMINFEASQNHNAMADDVGTPQIQNGDLAEADQSHIEVEEEGAVGGVIGIEGDVGNDDEIIIQDDSEAAKLEYPVSTEVEADLEEQGLDQVPTRLTTSSRPHSGTPSRGKKKRKR